MNKLLRVITAALSNGVLPVTLIAALAIMYFARALIPGQTVFGTDGTYAFSTQSW